MKRQWRSTMTHSVAVPATASRAGGADRGGSSSEVRNEMGRVTWPSRKEVYATTFVVILTSIFFGLYLSVVDFLLNSGISWIYRTFGAAS